MGLWQKAGLGLRLGLIGLEHSQHFSELDPKSRSTVGIDLKYYSAEDEKKHCK
jgi:hypothetical protein